MKVRRMNTREGGEDSVAQTEVSSITFGIGPDILSLPGTHLLFYEGVGLPVVLLQSCQPHGDYCVCPRATRVA